MQALSSTIRTNTASRPWSAMNVCSWWVSDSIRERLPSVPGVHEPLAWRRQMYGGEVDAAGDRDGRHEDDQDPVVDDADETRAERDREGLGDADEHVGSRAHAALQRRRRAQLDGGHVADDRPRDAAAGDSEPDQDDADPRDEHRRRPDREEQ